MKRGTPVGDGGILNVVLFVPQILVLGANLLFWGRLSDPLDDAANLLIMALMVGALARLRFAQRVLMVVLSLVAFFYAFGLVASIVTSSATASTGLTFALTMLISLADVFFLNRVSSGVHRNGGAEVPR